MTEQRIALNDAIARVLLRYFREGRRDMIDRPRIDAAADQSLLLAHWAMSSTTRDLWRYIIVHKHELETILTSRISEGTSGVRGRIEAVRTLLRRQVTHNAALFAYREQERSYAAGPNQLVAWILRKVHDVVQGFAAPLISPYATSRAEALLMVHDARRIEAMQSLLRTSTVGSARPPIAAIKQAAASRRAIYRKAYATYELLLALENGDEKSISAILRETLIAPLRNWQSFELFTALSIGTALERATGVRMQISNVTTPLSEPIIRVGTYGVYWQRHGPAYQPPHPERSEQHIDAILSFYGSPLAGDRPDIVIVDERNRRTLAIIEVKYFETEDSARDALRDAVEQVVRYARGYENAAPLEDILQRSLIALWSRREVHSPTATLRAGVPTLVDFDDLLEERADAWLASVLAGREAPPSAGNGSPS